MVAKYKEDLDQMMTNWMVHMRPDIYVKWWHPRNKTLPLESQILWGQSINTDSNLDIDISKRFQWKATTSFSFKSWVFPGLNDAKTDFNQEDIIEHFNIFPAASYGENANNSYEDVEGLTGYPVFGDIYNRDDAGFYAVETDQEFENDGSDPQGILQGKYMVNNVESRPDSILYDEVSGVLLSGQTMIEDLTLAGDIPTNLAYLNSFPAPKIWQGYIIPDKLKNEAIIFKHVYFKNGYSYNDITADPPSGDLIYNKFFSNAPKYLENGQITSDYNNPVVSAEFGTSFVDVMQPEYSYDTESKLLSICGRFNSEYYSTLIQSQMSSNGITQTISLKNTNQKYPIELTWVRGINRNYQIDNSQYKNIFKNVNVWRYPKNSEHEYVQLNLDLSLYVSKLRQLKEFFVQNWNNCTLDIIDEKKNIYTIKCDTIDFKTLAKEFETTVTDFTRLSEKIRFTEGQYEYTIVANTYMYFVLIDSETVEIEDSVYDWGIIDLPRFNIDRNPVYNVTLENANLVYGFSVDGRLSYK